jgi:hypothetical protein
MVNTRILHIEPCYRRGPTEWLSLNLIVMPSLIQIQMASLTLVNIEKLQLWNMSFQHRL